MEHPTFFGSLLVRLEKHITREEERRSPFFSPHICRHPDLIWGPGGQIFTSESISWFNSTEWPIVFPRFPTAYDRHLTFGPKKETFDTIWYGMALFNVSAWRLACGYYETSSRCDAIAFMSNYWNVKPFRAWQKRWNDVWIFELSLRTFSPAKSFAPIYRNQNRGTCRVPFFSLVGFSAPSPLSRQN